MEPLRLDISDPADHAFAASRLLEFAVGENVWLFEAPMGAGKTTFIKVLCKQLGVTGAMSSPTYSIVNEYITDQGDKLFHFDLYRLKDPSELYDIGFEEYLSQGARTFIEWPDLAKPFLDRFVRIIILPEHNKRYIYAEIIPAYA